VCFILFYFSLFILFWLLIYRRTQHISRAPPYDEKHQKKTAQRRRRCFFIVLFTLLFFVTNLFVVNTIFLPSSAIRRQTQLTQKIGTKCLLGRSRCVMVFIFLSILFFTSNFIYLHWKTHWQPFFPHPPVFDEKAPKKYGLKDVDDVFWAVGVFLFP
jgi:uncharacterized BrkB/YihY/UPF0761 family membrane protein